MKFKIYAFIAVTLLLSGCSNSSEVSDRKAKPDEVVARINDFDITLSEFNSLMKFESEVDPEFQVTIGNRKKFLDYLIQKELYIQEASKLKLDQKEDFIRSIEKYWESTLIRQLLELKHREFRSAVLVTEEEIADFHRKNRENFGDQPLDDVKDKIRKKIIAGRVAEMSQKWTDDLRRSAKIDISEALLDDRYTDKAPAESEPPAK